MRRSYYPYNGKRYVLNKNTLEVHDLDRETNYCKVNDIKSDHVHNCNTYLDAEMYARMFLKGSCNGCAYCMSEKNTG